MFRPEPTPSRSYKTSQRVFDVTASSQCPSNVRKFFPLSNYRKCGCCWAFAAIAALECHIFKATKKIVTLSEQNILDGCTDFDGCRGGYIHEAFDFILKNNGISTDANYPFVGKQKEPYTYEEKYKVAAIAGYTTIQMSYEDEMMYYLNKVGPLAVYIKGNLERFRKFVGDHVFYDRNCRYMDPDHCVLLIGYGTIEGKDYWLIKNSWGTEWGDEGYCKIARNKGNFSSTAIYALYPLLSGQGCKCRRIPEDSKHENSSKV